MGVAKVDCLWVVKNFYFWTKRSLNPKKKSKKSGASKKGPKTKKNDKTEKTAELEDLFGTEFNHFTKIKEFVIELKE